MRKIKNFDWLLVKKRKQLVSSFYLLPFLLQPNAMKLRWRW